MSNVLALLVALILCGLPLRADETLAGHSSHGEAFNEGPRQAAVLMEGTGKVHLPVATKNARAQKFFDQGVGQLHGFWFFEAERSFRQVAALDTNCAMAYWGMAMANVNNEKRAKEFLTNAVARRKFASAREQAWIDGLGKLYTTNGTKKDRDKEYVKSLIALTKSYPDELEAKAVLAWKLWELKVKEPPYDTNDKVDKLLDEIVAQEPMHPAHHYRIHTWDSANDPKRALASAALFGQSAPGIAHAWHMPGHTFSKLKRYDDASWQQEASARTDHAEMMKYWVLPDQIHNYAHNNEWLIRDLNFIGRVHDALDLSRNMIELPRHPKYNTPGGRGSANYGRTRLLETLVRYELWDDLLALNGSMYLEPSTNAATDAPRLRALGLAAFNKGNDALLAKQIAALEELQKKLPKPVARTNAPGATLAKNSPLTKKGPPGKRGEGAPKAGGGSSTNNYASAGAVSSSPAAAVSNALAELRGVAALAIGIKSNALVQLTLAKDTPKERLARHYLRLGDLAKAEQSARDAVRGATNEVVPLATLVEVLHKAGKSAEAKSHFETLRKVAANLDTDTPLHARMANLALALSLPRDWKLAPEQRADVGKRPALDSLGPYRWAPPSAPNWTLPTGDGRKISLADYRGKPVIVIFYLGHGCLHCIQQLQAFEPMAADFKKAGIELVAISKDSPAGLKLSVDKVKVDGEFPFPLVSDESLKTFKAWRCYDDFEKTALHGTFLLDWDGSLRWLDISYQPFMEGKFLLEEARRLLQLPKAKISQANGTRVAAH